VQQEDFGHFYTGEGHDMICFKHSGCYIENNDSLGRALVEEGRPDIPMEKATGIDQARDSCGLDLGAVKWFKIHWRPEPTDVLMDWRWY